MPCPGRSLPPCSVNTTRGSWPISLRLRPWPPEPMSTISVTTSCGWCPTPCSTHTWPTTSAGRFKRDHPQQTTLVLMFIDALHAGAAAVLMSFSVVPSADVPADPDLQLADCRRPAPDGHGLLVAIGAMALSLAYPAGTKLATPPGSPGQHPVHPPVHLHRRLLRPRAGPAPGPGARGDQEGTGEGRGAGAQPGQVPVAAGLGIDLQRQEERAPGDPAQEAHRVLLRHQGLHRAVRGAGGRGSSPTCSTPTSTRCRRSPSSTAAPSTSSSATAVLVFFGDPTTQGAKKDARGRRVHGHRHAQAHEGAAPAVAQPRASPSRWKSAWASTPATARWATSAPTRAWTTPSSAAK